MILHPSLHTHTHTHNGARLSVLFFTLLMVLPMMVGWGQEREDEKEETLEEILSKVTIDTFQIRATPYEKVLVNGVWRDEGKQIDYYNDITIYEIKKKETGQPSAMMSEPKPAIFMLPGGGFFGISQADTIGLSNNIPGQPVLSTNIQYGKANIDVSKLKEGQYKVIVWVNEVPLSSTFNVSR